MSLRSPQFITASLLAPASVFLYNELVARRALALGLPRECADWLNIPLLGRHCCGWDLTHFALFLYLTRLTRAFWFMQAGGLAWYFPEAWLLHSQHGGQCAAVVCAHATRA